MPKLKHEKCNLLGYQHIEVKHVAGYAALLFGVKAQIKL